MIDKWITEFRKKDVTAMNFDITNLSGIHPKIKNEFEAAKRASQTKTTILDACLYIANNSAWGNKQTSVLNSATVKDFEETIKSLEAKDLKFFMCHFIEMRLQPQAYTSSFGSAIDHFIEACGNISIDSNFKRLSNLIVILFEDGKLGSELRRADNVIEKA